jgi:CheY-like chemotaxis protein
MAKIVVCEDDVMIQKLIFVALRSSGHEILMANDGVRGCELIRAERPDLILTDLLMPAMTGLELCRTVRSDPAISGIPIIVLTASVQRQQAEESLREGASAFLPKPFTTDQLSAIIAQHLPCIR